MADTKHYTPEEVITALEASAGLISEAARMLGCHYTTVKNYIQDFPEVRAAKEEIRVRMLDLTESKLLTMINKGDKTGVFYFLNNQGGERGYGRKNRGSDGQFKSPDAPFDKEAEKQAERVRIILPDGTPLEF